jgi:hypothetical protein
MRTVSILGGINNAFFPTREDVEGVVVGSLAPDPFGQLKEVTKVFGQGDNVDGEAYVCYYTKLHGSSVSGSLVQDTLLLDMDITRKASSNEISLIEENLKKQLTDG